VRKEILYCDRCTRETSALFRVELGDDDVYGNVSIHCSDGSTALTQGYSRKRISRELCRPCLDGLRKWVKGDVL
jgi:hypothetical protein